MTTILFAAGEARWPDYEAPLKAALADAGLQADVTLDAPPESVDYIVYASDAALTDFTPFTNLKAVLNTWAGVESIVGNPTLTVPLTRMVDHGLTEGMVEYVTGHVLRYHLGLDRWIKGQPEDAWHTGVPPLARERKVTILGLGALGSACAKALVALNFDVAGWSRSQKDIEGIACFHGEAGLTNALARAEILVLLLPNTEETVDLIDARRLAAIPKGAVVINPGRGPLIVDEDLLDALDNGHIAHATLDVFREEPLPPDHAFRRHPKVTVTPHIAAETRFASACRVLAENVRRAEAGEPLLHVVDRAAGY